MIVFDLQCAQGHTFEGWFDSAQDMEDQLERALLTCPVCGEGRIRKVPSSFAIGKGGTSSPREELPDHEMAARLLSQALARHLRENFDDVGPQFASEALKIHYGVSEPRNIRGVSTLDEEKMLASEGVEFFKVGPLPPLSEGGGKDKN